ncbi:MAG TPA: phage portal protein [Methylomusa anaerophila]|uniref:Phage portal protein, lambda family n=1 Tax=Methylomusa anaerophila TaxID=1930071 RepID=A0A348AIZ9_9FIRM|nr:phage portal protein [Methylomusa anaerophila]BBB91047.1 phage portal protein, lambda family [Methylomusa anaerophila]HML88921.1 phage portal protein [Methylomusa anaerophila]
MNFIDKVISLVSPRWAYAREAYRQATEVLRNYDAARMDRLGNGWAAAGGTAEQIDRPYRERLLRRARDLERNNDIAKSVILSFERNVVGRGFNLQARVKKKNDDDDEKSNKAIEKSWKKWCHHENCDVTGQSSFNEILKMLIRRRIVDGEIFIVKTYDNTAKIPFRIQLIEPDQLDTSRQYGESGNLVKSGVEVNKVNKPVAYWLYETLPDGYFAVNSIRVPAERVIHLFSKHRPTQVRGISELASSMDSIRDSGEYLEAERVKARIAACFSMFVKVAPGSTNPYAKIQRMPVEGQKSPKRVDTIEPGMIEYLQPGEEIEVANPGNIPTNTKDFVEQQQRLVGAGQGLSYEMISRDVSKVTYSSARQGLLEDRKTFEPIQDYLIEHACIGIFTEFLISAVLAGEVEIKDFWQDKDRYLEHVWIPSGWTWIDPLKDVKASGEEVDSNFATLEEKCAEQGKDWKEVINQRAREKKYIQEKGVGSDNNVNEGGGNKKTPAAGAGG